MKLDRTMVFVLAISFVIFPAFYPVMADSPSGSKKNTGQNWWESHPGLTKWLAGTLGGVAGSLVGSAVFSILSYPFFSGREEPLHPELTSLYFGFAAGYPLGSAIGASMGVKNAGSSLGQQGDLTKAYIASGLAAGASFYGSLALGAGLKGATKETSLKQLINVATGSIALSTPLVASIGASWGYGSPEDSES